MYNVVVFYWTQIWVDHWIFLEVSETDLEEL